MTFDLKIFIEMHCAGHFRKSRS